MKTNLLLLMCCAGPLLAQSGEVWASAGASILANPGIGSSVPGGNRGEVKLDDGFRVGFRFTYNTESRWGHEIQYGYNRSALSDSTGQTLGFIGSEGMAIHQVGYNLLYYLKPSEDERKVRPFVTAGVNVVSFSAPVDVRGGSPSWGFNYGGGVKYRISRLFGLRWDVRGYDSGKPNWSNAALYNRGSILQQFETSVGFGVFF